MPVTRTLGNRDGQMLRTCQPSLAKTASFQVDEKPYLREIKWIETEKDATHTPGHAPHTHPAHTSNRHKDNKELGTEHTAPCLVTQHLHLGGVEEPSLSSWVLPWQVVVEAGHLGMQRQHLARSGSLRSGVSTPTAAGRLARAPGRQPGRARLAAAGAGVKAAKL